MPRTPKMTPISVCSPLTVSFQAHQNWYLAGRRSVRASMKLAPLGLWKMYSSVLYFGHPPVTWQLRAHANVEDLLVRKCPKKKRDITWQSWCSILYPCLHTHKHMLLLNIQTLILLMPPESFLMLVDSLFPPFLPVLLTYSFLLSWKWGIFGLVSVFVQNISVLRESRAWVSLPL